MQGCETNVGKEGHGTRHVDHIKKKKANDLEFLMGSNNRISTRGREREEKKKHNTTKSVVAV